MQRYGNGREVRGLASRRWSRRWWLLLPLLAVAWPVTNVATKAASLSAYTVASGSMAPTLAAGDRVCAQAPTRPNPQRGEIWVFRMPSPGSAIPNIGVKRVLGLP